MDTQNLECVDLAAVEDHRSVSVRTDLDVWRVNGPVNRNLSTADPGDAARFPAHRQVPCGASGTGRRPHAPRVRLRRHQTVRRSGAAGAALNK